MKLNDGSLNEIEHEDIETVRRRVENRKRGHRRHRRSGHDGHRKGRIIVVLIPVIILLIIIGIIIGAIKGGALDDIGSSKTEADRNALFGITDENQVGILFNDNYIEDTAILSNGKIYLPLEFVLENLNAWFYYDSNEKLLLYSTPTETKQWAEGDVNLLEQDGKICIALDLVKEYTSLTVSELMENPSRIVIRTEFGTVTTADVTKSSAVRVSDSKKSEVITKAKKGDKVRIISSNNLWSTVETSDGYVGYIRNKRLASFTDGEEKAENTAADLNYDNISYDGKIILGWHQVTNKDANNTVDSMLASDSAMNVISPTWYSITDTEGNLSDISSADYVTKAHNAGVKVWAVVDNFNASGFSATDDTLEVLSYTTKRQKLINTLVSSVAASGADGINVDFEQLSGETGLHFAQFVKELYIAAHAQGLVVSVDNYVPKAYSMLYHREVQGVVCDYVVIMGYDEHTAGSDEAGPVASIDFVREGIEQTILDVDPSKIINGVPFYTRIWEEENGTVKNSSAVGMNEAASFVSNHGMSTAWDDVSGANYAEGTSGNTTYRVWLEDAESIKEKFSVMDANNIAGAAFWKLGLESSDIWNLIEAYASGNSQ